MSDYKQSVRDETARQLDIPASADALKKQGKDSARDQTAHQLNIPALSANALKNQGEDSVKRRGKSFEPTELRFPGPGEEKSMQRAGEGSISRRKHVTENIADSYQSSSS